MRSGNHMWFDEPAADLSDAAFERSLLSTGEALAAAGAGAVHLMRPGSGLVSRRKVRIAAAHGYRCVLGSVYPFDPQVPLSSWMSWCVRRALHPGAIVILHEGNSSRKAVLGVLDEVLADAAGRGFRSLTASHLLAATPPVGADPRSRAQ